jgi:hypothetical protein
MKAEIRRLKTVDRRPKLCSAIGLPRSAFSLTPFFFFLLTFVCGCAGMTYSPGSAAVPPGGDFQRHGRDYPPQWTMVQRVRVDVAGRVFHFTAYLEVRRAEGFHGVGLGEMGVKVFEFRREAGRGEILRKPDSLPPRPLIDGVIEDLWHLYRAAGQTGEWVRRPGIVGAVERESADTLSEYQFDEAGGRLAHSWRVERGRVVSVFEYADWKTFPGWEAAALPARIEIRNRRWRYRMTIRLLKLSTAVK